MRGLLSSARSRQTPSRFPTAPAVTPRYSAASAHCPCAPYPAKIPGEQEVVVMPLSIRAVFHGRFASVSVSTLLFCCAAAPPTFAAVQYTLLDLGTLGGTSSF